MKAKITFLILSCMGALLLARCSNDTHSGGKNADGEPTFMQVSFTTPRSMDSRAGNDDKATDEEQNINSVDVFVFDELTGTQVTHKRLETADFTGPTHTPGTDRDTYTATDPIETTTGRKVIVIGINLSVSSGGWGQTLVDKPLADFTNAVYDVTTPLLSDTANGFIMFSTEPVKKEFIASATGNENNVAASVERMVAKLTVQIPDAGPEVQGGSVTDLKFVINNQNLKSYLIRKPNWVDPNWETYDPGEFTASAPESDYLPVDVSSTAIPALQVKYMTENTAKDFSKTTNTYATVQGKFIPTQVMVFANGVDATGGFRNETGHGITAPRTFWSVEVEASGSSAASRDYFYDETVADAFVADRGAGATKFEFTDGVCYYNMWLNPGEDFNVKRNDYYKATIRKILGPGGSDDDIRNPQEPPSQQTYIEVDIEILHWNFKEDDYNLQP